MKKVYFNDTYKQTESVIAGSKTMFHMFIPDGNYTARHWNTRLYRNPHAYYKDSRGMCQIINNDTEKLLIPKYQIGETVAVAQSMHDVCKESDPEFKTIGYLSHCFGKAWTNKMFVEANRMPHQIKITNIRMAFLQDISEEDCLREGIHKGKVGNENHWMDAYYTHKSSIEPHCKPREAFADLIDKLNGEGTWNLNPLTIFFEFELIK